MALICISSHLCVPFCIVMRPAKKSHPDPPINARNNRRRRRRQEQQQQQRQITMKNVEKTQLAKANKPSTLSLAISIKKPPLPIRFVNNDELLRGLRVHVIIRTDEKRRRRQPQRQQIYLVNLLPAEGALDSIMERAYLCPSSKRLSWLLMYTHNFARMRIEVIMPTFSLLHQRDL